MPTGISAWQAESPALRADAYLVARERAHRFGSRRSRWR